MSAYKTTISKIAAEGDYRALEKKIFEGFSYFAIEGKLPVAEAEKASLMQCVVDALNESKVLKSPLPATEVSVPKFEGGFSKNLRKNVTIDELSDKAKNLGKVYAALGVQNSQVFEGAYRIALYTSEKNDYEDILLKTQGYIESIKRVGISRATQELAEQYVLSSKGESSLKYSVAIYDKTKNQNPCLN